MSRAPAPSARRNGELAAALLDAERQHRIHAGHGEHQRDRGERADQRGVESRGGRRGLGFRGRRARSSEHAALERQLDVHQAELQLRSGAYHTLVSQREVPLRPAGGEAAPSFRREHRLDHVRDAIGRQCVAADLTFTFGHDDHRPATRNQLDLEGAREQRAHEQVRQLKLHRHDATVTLFANDDERLLGVFGARRVPAVGDHRVGPMPHMRSICHRQRDVAESVLDAEAIVPRRRVNQLPAG